jgi:predicted double-glycine peptidase
MNPRHRLLGAAALLPVLHAAPAPALELPVLAGARLVVPVASIKQLRFQSTLRQQYDFSCGSAALATLLTYHYGVAVSEQAVFEQMFLHGDQRTIRSQGFSLLDMQRYLAARGLRADGFEQPLQKLIDSALPAIVLVADEGYRHFVVIKGAADGRILVGDPSSGTRVMGRAAFEAIWANKLLFVIHGSPVAPQFNLAADWRAAPRAPLDTGIDRSGLGLVTLSKHGAGGF